MDSGWEFLGYVALKFLAYVMWCYVGVGLLRTERTLRSAFGLGAVRLMLGVLFGFGVFLIGGMAHLEAPSSPMLLYLEIYAPVRWMEWGVMAWLMRRQDRGPAALLLGADNQSRLWRAGGILVSIIADLPILLSRRGANEMLPIGRFLC
ncbi:MAG TPA: hypothetical protein VMS96_00990 [Terriglobales bacterium]|nr:hypothetical protein [Terriglobales bacterium]